ncbi:hypothetical protein V6N12_052189 [Hibiscus sabdariffa]|uniref:RNase H type-1 domain-containing protein n=1 Tax=Hibiscus sabdariffa TaxID=183260 RepID=A0ABR2GHT5_9ROSI
MPVVCYCERHESIAQASLRLQQECIQSTGVVARSSVAIRSASRQGVRWRKPLWELVDWFCSTSICSTVEAELWDNYEGLLAAWFIGCRCLIIEVDSAVVADLIRNYKSDVTTFSLVSHIATLLKRSW